MRNKKFDEKLYLESMYIDGYFPNFLVDKIKAMLMEIVHCFENAEYAELT